MTTTKLEPAVVAQSPEARPEALRVLAARTACAWEYSMLKLVLASNQNLGHLERPAEQDVRELLRQTTERGAQAKPGPRRRRAQSAASP